MIVGAHAVIYSRRPDADRAFFRDVLRLKHVDAGGGWLIFAVPRSEVAFHPGHRNNVHEFYLLVTDVEAFVARMARHQVRCGLVRDLNWGRLTHVRLPGGGRLGVYEPSHRRPRAARRKGRARPKRSRAA